ncbi:2-C-methyl-D-erythritol 4-phosphate cytidylyltransferase [Caldalkalibacillus thermarum]|uniref:2-C-methyl-D-erythritol 4-phosphate cytidylyltransferase n=1 Tax=Caldalkalibacillus thermarum TaxID=296745 RepID=UPI00166A6B5C|nr:2-C-methyl-D-erythritol 4-phosphate cytidylyltransferase [Caldalkalibacillus thermarum]GGK21616.1 2-C-methyl-D-erythritol 4-phosphate cytidylyltransferase [Caldalkalibacillus thermarum]
MKVSAVIVAAGKGKRMGLGKNKAFLDLEGKPLLVHTLSRWQRFSCVTDITVVAGEEELGLVKELIKQHRLSKVRHVVAGGRERQESVFYGLKALGQEPPDVVLIHDGARPFLAEGYVQQVVDAVQRYGAAILAVPVKDTIKVVDNGHIASTLDRSKLWAAQTPQGFKYALIVKAHEEARRQQREATDDAALVEAMGHAVYIVPGSEYNIKLTTPEDIDLARSILKRSEEA